jgi:uncharacterized membrane protein (DUF485 family)
MFETDSTRDGGSTIPSTGRFFHEPLSQATGDTRRAMWPPAAFQEDLLGNAPKKPPVESSAIRRPMVTPQTQASDVDWQIIENSSDFRELVREKRHFIIPATIFFLIYYFGFLVLVGYFPSVVEVNVIGNINLAYLLALSEFVMAWIIVYLYVRRAGLFDKLANAILTKVKGGVQ